MSQRAGSRAFAARCRRARDGAEDDGTRGLVWPREGASCSQHQQPVAPAEHTAVVASPDLTAALPSLGIASCAHAYPTAVSRDAPLCKASISTWVSPASVFATGSLVLSVNLLLRPATGLMALWLPGSHGNMEDSFLFLSVFFRFGLRTTILFICGATCGIRRNNQLIGKDAAQPCIMFCEKKTRLPSASICSLRELSFDCCIQ